MKDVLERQLASLDREPEMLAAIAQGQKYILDTTAALKARGLTIENGRLKRIEPESPSGKSGANEDVEGEAFLRRVRGRRKG